jgi:hypothetical protein
MKREAHGRRTQRPQAEHRLSGPADPEKRGSALLEHQRERETDHVAVELDRAVQVADREMGFE